MELKFSDRMGYTKPKSVLQIKSIDEDLRNGIWNCLTINIFNKLAERGENYEAFRVMEYLIEKLWIDFFIFPLDQSPSTKYAFIESIRAWFFKCEWYKVYNFIEFVIQNHLNEIDSKKLARSLDEILKREFAGYRVAYPLIIPITSDIELNEITRAVNSPVDEVNAHINQSLKLLSDKQNPDYRNSIKESISSVEALCRKICKSKKLTLGDALSELEKHRIKLHGAIRAAFEKMYGWTSDSAGIRHSLTEEENLDLEDALFMIVSCSAFINFLISKASKAGIKL